MGEAGTGQKRGSRITLTASGPVSAALAWERYDVFDLWPTWSPQLRRVECDLERLASGARGRAVGPLGFSVEFTVEELDRARRTWAWTVHRGPITLRLEHGVEDDGAGSRTWLTIQGPLPVIAGYAPAAWYALHRLVTI